MWTKHHWFMAQLLSVTLGAVTGCGQRPPIAASPPATPAPSITPAWPDYKASIAANGYLELWQLAGVVPTSEDTARKLWSELFSQMAQDEKTLELLRKLHGGLPVELIAVESARASDQDFMMSPPSEGFEVAIRLADNSIAHTNLGGGKKVPARSISFGHVVLIKNAAGSVGGEFGVSGPPNGTPVAFEPIKLAMEDFFLRHAPGWLLNNGEYSNGKELPASIDEQRADLDARIKACADYAQTFYDKRHPRP